MKRTDFFDNLNCMFVNSEDTEEYVFTKAAVYRNVSTGEIESVQIINTEYKEFVVIDRDGDVDFVNMDEAEQDKLTGVQVAKNKKK